MGNDHVEPEQPQPAPEDKRSRSLLKRLLDIGHRLFLALFLFLFFVGLLLQFPFFQNWAVRQSTQALQNKLDTRVEIGAFRLGWMSRLVLQEVVIYDLEQDTLLQAGTLIAQIDPNLITFIRKGLIINEVTLKDAQLHMRKLPNAASTNLQQLLDRLFPPKEQERKGTFRMLLKRLYLERIRFQSNDLSRGNALDIFLQKGMARVDSMELTGKKMRVRELILSQPVLRVVSRLPEGPVAEVLVVAPKFPDTLRWDIGIESFELNGGRFVLDNYAKEPVRLSPPGELNYRHMDVDKIRIQVRDFRYQKETFTGQIESIALQEQQGFVLDRLSIRNAEVSGRGIALKGVDLATPNSSLGDTLIFRYSQYADFTEFTDKVLMDGKFADSRLAIRDILTFAPGLARVNFFANNLNESITLNGRIWGRINNLKGSDLKLALSNGSTLDGNFSSRNLAVPNEEYLILNLNRLSTTAPMLRKLIPNLPANVDRLGRLNFRGNFTGFFYNFVAYGNLNSDLGSARMDMQMQLTGGKEKARYNGKLTLDEFDLGKWTGDPNLGKISVASSVEEGIGLTGETAQATLKADIRSFVFKNYNYQNAVLQGKLRANRFNGDFSIQDDNIDLNFTGQVDLTQGIPLYDFEVEVNKLALQPLNLIEKGDIVLSGVADLNLRNKRFSDIEGEIRLSRIRAEKDGQIFQLDSAVFSTYFDHFGNKNFMVRSDVLDAELNGLFEIEKIPVAIQQHLARNYPGFSKRLGIVPKDTLERLSHFDFRIDILNSKGFETLIDPRMGSLSNMSVTGKFNNQTGLLTANLIAPSLQFDRIFLEDIALDVQMERSTGNLDLSVNRTVVNERQEFETLTLLTYLSGDTLQYGLNYANRNAKKNDSALDKLDLDGVIFVLDSNRMQHQIDQSEIVLLGTIWKINRNNTIEFGKDILSIQDFILTRDNKAISLESKGNRGLEVAFLNFDITEVNSLINFKPIRFSGMVNASVSVGDIFKLKDMSLAVVSDTLFLNNDDWGILRVDASLADTKKPLHLYLNLTRDTAQLIAEGYYNLDDFGPSAWQKKGFFNLDLNIHSYPLSIAEYFIGETVSQMQGSFDANLQFSGQFSQPQTTGKIFLYDAALQVDYLKTRYSLDRAVVNVDNYLFDATNTILKDKYNNTARITGGIRHRYLKDFGFNARLSTEQFLGMDTKKGDNKLFYGQGVAAGTVTFTGSFAQPNIYINAQAIGGTRVAIPVSSERDAGQLKFFRFVDKDKPVIQAEGPQPADLKGVNFEMDLIVNEAALMQIIFNEQAGDIIEGNGRGALRIVVPRNGDFQMFGDVVIERGEYLFTLYNVINKDFNIRRGGSISWSGDPYRAIINLEAEYKGLNTSVSTFIQEFLLSGSDNVRSEASQSTVVNLLLKLQGELLSPSISFDLAFPNLQGELLSYTENKLRLLRQDPNEMNKQVFGLIVAGQFLPADFSFQGSQIIYNTVSEFLSNQLSLMITELFSELLGGQALSSVDFDIVYNQYQNANLTQSGNLNRGNELQVSLRQNYFNDRLSILVGGNIDLGNNWRTATGATGAFIGNDLVIEYQLVKDRSVKLRIYQKLLPDISGRILRVGTGISVRKEFDSFGEFLRSFRTERRKNKKPARTAPVQDSLSLQ